jgi:hypothetical protein
MASRFSVAYNIAMTLKMIDTWKLLIDYRKNASNNLISITILPCFLW